MRDETSHIFIDESGDAGPRSNKEASSYFIIGAAFFPQKNWLNCQTDLTRILLDGHGVKSCSDGLLLNCNPKTFKHYLRHFLTHEGLFACVYAEKGKVGVSNLLTRQKNESGVETPCIYDKMVKQLLAQFVECGGFTNNVYAHIHTSQGKDDRRKRRSYLLREINRLLHPFAFQVRHHRYEEAVGIQCAHLICNGLFKKFEKEDERYYRLIKNALIFEEHYKKE